jgi:hypothetical protein
MVASERVCKVVEFASTNVVQNLPSGADWMLMRLVASTPVPLFDGSWVLFKNGVDFCLAGETNPVPQKATQFLFRFMSPFDDVSIEFQQK